MSYGRHINQKVKVTYQNGDYVQVARGRLTDFDEPTLTITVFDEKFDSSIIISTVHIISCVVER